MPADERQNLVVDKYRAVFRANLKALLDHHGVTRLTVKAYYLDGPKRGKQVSSRAIGYMLSKDSAAPSPSLDMVAAVAAAYDLLPWQLLVPAFDPANPPMVRLTPEERKLYAEFQRLRTALTGEQHKPRKPSP